MSPILKVTFGNLCSRRRATRRLQTSGGAPPEALPESSLLLDPNDRRSAFV